MARITEKDLDLMVGRLNAVKPMAGYTFSINKAYGGYMLVKREISTGGQSELTIRTTARTLFEIMAAIENFCNA